MASETPDRSAILLHAQLLDARIWGALERLVAADAAVQTLSVPPLHTIGSPAVWSDHIGHHARVAISPGAVDLAVTIGGAGEAGVGLVRDGFAHAALLLDPDTGALLTDPTGNAHESMLQMLHEPDVTDKAARFFQRLDPDFEEVRARGTMSEEGIDMFVDALLADDEHLPEPDRELLRRIATEQLAATLPLDLEAQQQDPPERPDWITLLAPVALRCTVAIGDSPLYRRLDFDGVLRRRVPDLEIVHLAGSSSAWISAPHEVGALIHELLQR